MKFQLELHLSSAAVQAVQNTSLGDVLNRVGKMLSKSKHPDSFLLEGDLEYLRPVLILIWSGLQTQIRLEKTPEEVLEEEKIAS